MVAVPCALVLLFLLIAIRGPRMLRQLLPQDSDLQIKYSNVGSELEMTSATTNAMQDAGREAGRRERENGNETSVITPNLV